MSSIFYCNGTELFAFYNKTMSLYLCATPSGLFRCTVAKNLFPHDRKQWENVLRFACSPELPYCMTESILTAAGLSDGLIHELFLQLVPDIYHSIPYAPLRLYVISTGRNEYICAEYQSGISEDTCLPTGERIRSIREVDASFDCYVSDSENNIHPFSEDLVSLPVEAFPYTEPFLYVEPVVDPNYSTVF